MALSVLNRSGWKTKSNPQDQATPAPAANPVPAPSVVVPPPPVLSPAATVSAGVARSRPGRLGNWNRRSVPKAIADAQTVQSAEAGASAPELESLKPAQAEPASLLLQPALSELATPSASPAQSSKPDEKAAEVVEVYQQIYVPRSRLPPTGALVPSDIAKPMAQALVNFEANYGPVDDFVAMRMGVSMDRLGKLLTAEQVDGVALGVAAADEKRGMIVADQTGFGKGRILAAIALCVARSGKTNTFITEKAGLFSDIFRDLRDVHATNDIGAPLLINADSEIVDMHASSEKLFGAGAQLPLYEHEKALMKRTIESGRMPAGTKMQMGTYSQFNRKKNPRSDYLVSSVKDGHMLLDEAHGFIGDSATSEVFAEAIEAAASTTFSSATFARGIGNLSAYRSVMPWLQPAMTFGSVDPAQLPPNLRRALAEASLIRAVAMGSLVRREHDMSGMKLEMVDAMSLDPEHGMAFIEDAADKFATVMQAMMWVSKTVQSVVDRRNNNLSDEERANKASWSMAGFGARLSQCNQQFMCALKIQAAVNSCIQTLKIGEKPVIVMDTTMESMLEELQSLPGLVGSGEFPEFRHALSVIARKLFTISFREKPKADPVKFQVDEPVLVEALDRLLNMLKKFPSLPLSPLDALRKGVEEEGRKRHALGLIPRPWKVGEISGRNLILDDTGSVVTAPFEQRSSIISAFVNGGVDVLQLTRAGAVGLSAHDAAQYLEHARRHMIEVFLSANVLLRSQTWGRVFRRGQITMPRFSTICLPLPSEIYQMASQNRKLKEMSASVSGNAAALTMAKDIPDPIDGAGERAAVVLLDRDPQLCEQLYMGKDEDGKGSGDDHPTVSKMLRRLSLLPLKRQREVMTEFDLLREEMLRGFPEEPSVLDGVWRITGSEILDPASPDRAELKLVSITSQRERRPITGERLRTMIKLGQAETPDLEAAFSENYDKALSKVRQTASSEKVLREMTANLKKVEVLVRSLVPGMVVRVPGAGEDAIHGLVVSRSCPNLQEVHSARSHIVQCVCPGDEAPRRFLIETFLKHPNSYGPVNDQQTALRGLLPRFDSERSSTTTLTRKILMGDPVDEALAAIRLKGGSRSAFQCTTAEGEKQWLRGVVVPKHLEKSVKEIPVVLPGTEEALRLLVRKQTLFTGLRYDSPVMQITVVAQNTLGIQTNQPQASREAARLFKHLMPEGEKPIKIDSTWQEIRLDGANVQAAIDLMFNRGIRLHAPATMRHVLLGHDMPANAVRTQAQTPRHG